MTRAWSEVEFAQKVIAYYHQSGRKDLPWQNTQDPYRIWLSEIMLQQTQVKTVIPYYQKFLQAFPSVLDLANAEQDQVLHLWSGLGYYSRARNLHKAAKMIRDEFAGQFPENQAELESLPGIGRSTAGAIAAFAFNKPSAILDGNVKRVLARCFAIEGWYGQTTVLNQLWELSEKLTPNQETAGYNQAMMDLGALVCKRSKPLCQECPLTAHCLAFQQDRVSELPHKKPKKARPAKSVYWLIYLDKQRILLQKRPPSGIWGGLWSLPEVERTEAVKQNYSSARRLPEILHKFSHYDLHITPLLMNKTIEKTMQQEPNMSIMEADSSDWYSLTEPLEELAIGLPTPVTNLLKQLKQTLE
ncbi:A/G-specific adenine glycosylase [Kangiella sp. TOML190]|uniref:A/G-specific adenine glycosylase n=1 Tax=Kangiella sp. TOML190 TaxID=2931351 RepID=UPI00203F92E6|nr:A/G-specific adenine glycosylase [Kangiella sp. TOML190]